MNKIKLNMDRLVCYFFIYSALGWLLETGYSFLVLGHFENRGFLIGPICPIYGFGMLIMILWLSRYRQKPLKLFFLSILVFSIFEYVVSYGLDAIFHLKWWDYTQDFMNVNGRISLFYSFGWGIIGLVVIHLIHPCIQKITNPIFQKVPVLFQDSILKLLVIIAIIDCILSSIGYWEKSNLVATLFSVYWLS